MEANEGNFLSPVLLKTEPGSTKLMQKKIDRKIVIQREHLGLLNSKLKGIPSRIDNPNCKDHILFWDFPSQRRNEFFPIYENLHPILFSFSASFFFLYYAKGGKKAISLLVIVQEHLESVGHVIA
nr:hypothetical transcript [Hymenolepis microstoma]